MVTASAPQGRQQGELCGLHVGTKRKLRLPLWDFPEYEMATCLWEWSRQDNTLRGPEMTRLGYMAGTPRKLHSSLDHQDMLEAHSMPDKRDDDNETL